MKYDGAVEKSVRLIFDSSFLRFFSYSKEQINRWKKINLALSDRGKYDRINLRVSKKF